MKKITTSEGEWLFVEVPDQSRDFKVFNDENPYLSFFEGMETPRIYLSEGQYAFIAITKTITEDQAKEVVCEFEKISLNDKPFVKFNQPMYENYMWDKVNVSDWMYKSAIQSLTSLLKANGLDLEKNYAILKVKG